MMGRNDTREPRPCIEYVRVSTQEQGRSGLGLEGQREAIRGFCEAERVNVVASFVEIESAKGDTLERRPKLKAALKAAKRIKDDDYRRARKGDHSPPARLRGIIPRRPEALP